MELVRRHFPQALLLAREAVAWGADGTGALPRSHCSRAPDGRALGRTAPVCERPDAVDLYELFIQPFAEFGFMRRALVACVALALGSAPMGTLLVLRHAA